MAKIMLVVAAVSGFGAVALGAFGAHGLKSRLSPEMMLVFQTAVQYHFYHTLALLVVAALLVGRPGDSGLLCSAVAFVVGLMLFSGSLYTMAITDVRWLGAITPLGGLAFLFGWLALAWSGWKLA